MAQILLGIVELQRLLLFSCDHRHPSMDLAEDLRLRGGVDPIRQLGQPVMQSAPEFDPVGHRQRQQHRAEARNVLIPDPAVQTAGLGHAHLQPRSGLSETDEHRVVATVGRFR